VGYEISLLFLVASIRQSSQDAGRFHIANAAQDSIGTVLIISAIYHFAIVKKGSFQSPSQGQNINIDRYLPSLGCQVSVSGLAS